MERHYEVLGTTPDASLAEVRRRYRELLKAHHPDQGGSREEFLRIKTAYEEITGETAPVDPSAVSVGRGTVAHAPTFDPDLDPDGRADSRLSIAGDFLTLSLVALVQDLELERIVADPVLKAGLSRPTAFFAVHNTSDRPLAWRGRAETNFIGEDGFMYEGSSVVTPASASLPDRWWAGDAVLPPGRALRAVVVAGEVPPAVDVVKVIYTQRTGGDEGGGAGTERYLFDVDREVRSTLDAAPFDGTEDR